MGIDSVKDIVDLRGYLKGKYAKRDSAFRQLRAFYNADYWSGKTDVGGIKLIYNLLANVVDRFTDFMSQTPDWRVLPFEMSTEAIAMADKQEKLLYSQWELNNFGAAQQWQAHLQSLLGSFGFEILPNPNVANEPDKYVKINVINPDFTYPMPRTDNIRDLDSVIILAYDYKNNRDLYAPEQRQDQRRELTNITKFYDKEKIVVLKNDIETLRIQHDLGFIPLVLGQNRVKPFAVEGIGDLEQAVGLNQYLNELLSWQADIIEYAANPITIVKNHTGDQKLPVGPSAIWHGNSDFSAQFLTWAGQPPQVEQMINRVIQAIQDTTNMSEPIFGRDVPSGTSGSAVRSLLSGIQATMLRKQVGLGQVYQQVNEVIFKMVERMFKDKDIVIRGTRKGNVFVEKFKGKDINGNYRNQVIWPAGILDQASRVDVEIRKKEAGLQSEFTTMENIGVLSPRDESKLIRSERNEALERELIQSGNLNPNQAQFNQAAQQLAAGDLEGGGGAAPEQQLIEAIRGIDKIKGDVFFGGKEGEKFIIVLTDNKDKATILNRVPEEFKGKIEFKKFNESEDAELTPIVEKEEVAA